MNLEMGIIKVDVSIPELARALEEFKKNRLKALETFTSEVKSAVSDTINQILRAEMSIFLGDPGQESNKRNGYEEKEYALKGIGCIRIRVPIDRKRKFNSLIIPKREQMDPRLKQDIAALHLSGISTSGLTTKFFHY